MEKVIKKKIKGKFSIRIQDIACAGVSILLGILTSNLQAVFVFIFLSYCYMRDKRETLISIFFILLSTFTQGIVVTYTYALGITSYFIIIHLIKLWNQNVYQWLPYVTTSICIAFGIQLYGIEIKALLLPLLTFLCMREVCRDYSWINRGIQHHDAIRGLLVFGIGIFAGELFPIYSQEIYMVMMLLIALLSNSYITVVVSMFVYLLMNIPIDIALIITVMISVLKKDKKSALVFLIGACILHLENTYYLIFDILCISGVLLIPSDRIIEKNLELEQYQDLRFSQTSLLKRQMHNYANIFQSLAQYYAQISDVQAELLSNMASALQYNAEAIQKIDGFEKDSMRIKKALEGYQYDVKDISIEEPREGCIQIVVDIGNIRRTEIRSTLLPLFEVLLRRNLQIVEVHSRKFFRGYHSITICDDIPFTIDAYADSIKNSYTSSGDTFSIFKFRQSLVCMISDGMGNGDRAAQSSHLITNIFQRMMISGIPQENAIKCINKLIQSDTFATLDVVCFDRSLGVAYISKSAACPTFLIRNHNIYEINGKALPVGIVSQIQPDCFQVDLQDGDEYVMISDGIYMNEIYKWLSIRKEQGVKEDVESFSELLRKNRRKDDSTIVLAKVNKA